MIRILLVDDQKSVRAKIQYLLESAADLMIVGVAEDGYTAISLVASLKPDVVLIDIEMPGIDGISVTEEISHKFPKVKVLIMSSYDDSNYVSKSISVGAYGYILKTTPGEELGNVIRSVYQGYGQIGPGLLQKIVTQVPEVKPEQSSAVLQEIEIKPNIDQLGISQTFSTIKKEEYIPDIGFIIRFGGIFLFSIIAIGIGLFSILPYTKVVKAPAVARPQGELRFVEAPISGTITNLKVATNQSVEQGATIATIDDYSLQNRKIKLENNINQEKLQLTQISSQIQILEGQIKAQTNFSDRKIKSVIADLKETLLEQQEQEITLQTQIQETEASLKASKAAFNAAQLEAQRLNTVAQAGAISQTQYEQAQLEVQQNEQEVIVNQAQLTRAKNNLVSHQQKMAITKSKIDDQIAQEKAAKLVDLASLQQQKEALIQQQTQLQSQLANNQQELIQAQLDLDKTVVKAPVSGTIFQLKIRNPNQQVSLGEEIALITPSNNPIIFKAMVAVSDLNQVKLEQKVQIKISACPYSDYGMLEGKVTDIAPDTTNNAMMDNSFAEAETRSFYEVIIKPNFLELQDGEEICKIKSGMNGTASIITQEETVLKLILRKVLLGLDF